MAKAHVHYQALLNDRGTATIQTSLKVTSGANGFKVMDPFDWTKDKAIYQRWQYSQKRLDSPLMPWKVTQNGEGMGHIESWKNGKTLICQSAYDELDEDEKEGKYSSESIESYFTLFELLLAP